jgi:hypothetical protein
LVCFLPGMASLVVSPMATHLNDASGFTMVTPGTVMIGVVGSLTRYTLQWFRSLIIWRYLDENMINMDGGGRVLYVHTLYSYTLLSVNHPGKRRSQTSSGAPKLHNQELNEYI